MLVEPTVTLLPFSILFTAELTRLIAPRQLSRTVFVYGTLSLITFCALITGAMDSTALAVSMALFLLAMGASDWPRVKQVRWAHWVSITGVLAVAAALLLHAVPGFDNPVISRDLRLSPNSTAFDLYWNLDKGLVGLAFLLYLVPAKRLGYGDLRTFSGAVAIGITLAALLLPTAVAVGILAWDPKLPAVLPWWAPANLLITCLTEEAIFRGFLQERFSQWFGPRLPHGELLAVATASVLFGAAHFAGGIGYMFFAAVAGFGYGLAYRYSGLLGAVLAHFLLNTTHFLLFTYPLAS